MTATPISALVGSLITLGAGASVLLNLSVLFVIRKSGLTKTNHIYFLAFSNMLGQACHMSIIAFYLGPSSIAQDFLFPYGKDGFGAKLVAYLFIGLWYQEMFLQIVISVNRLINVIFPTKATFFTRNRTIGIAIGVYILGYLCGAMTNFIYPCCRVYIWFGDYGYAYLDSDFNYVDWYFELELNAISSFIALLCYTKIYFYILRANRKISNNLQQDEITKRRSKEVRYALQFAGTSCFIAFAWINFRVFPKILGSSAMEWYALITYAVIIHCSANALIFITINKEFRQHFIKIIFKNKKIRVSHTDKKSQPSIRPQINRY